MTAKVDTLDSAGVKRWYRMIMACFIGFGIAWTSLVVRLPEVREQLGVNTAQFGIILFVGSLGSLVSLNLVGSVISRVGTRKIIVICMSSVFIMTIIQSLVAEMHLAIGFAIAWFLAAFAAGASDVGVNLDGSAIEQRLGKTVMTKFHAGFSIGTVIGAGLGALGTNLQISLLTQLSVLGIASLGLSVAAWFVLPEGNGVHDAAKPTTEAGHMFGKGGWVKLPLFLLGFGIFGMTLAEGASNDWLPMSIVDHYGTAGTTTNGAIAYAFLVGSMTLTRFFGGHWADRFGRARTLQVLALVGIGGLLIVILGAPNIYLAWLGAALWGAGVALGFPLFLSAAGEMENPARKVAFVTAFGYGSALVGPPVLGFLGQAWGLLNVFYVVCLFLVLTFFVSASTGNAKKS